MFSHRRNSIAFQTLLGMIALLFQIPPLMAADPNDGKLNVIVILADDLGWADTSLYGHTRFHKTPNLDRLAKRGMVFTRAYSASPLCSPTRSAILTGLSPARTGITTPSCHLPQVVLDATVSNVGPDSNKATMPSTVTRLKTDYPTLVKSLKQAGYATGHFGKWHLGHEPYSPFEHGFDVDLPHTPGPGPAGSFVAPWKFANFTERTPNEHIEDRMAAEADTFIEQNRSKPFYLNYWMFSVHAPFDAKKALIDKYRDQVDPNDPQRSPTYAAMIESMDDAVGSLLDSLDRNGLSDRTVIIFTSDNGGNMYNEVDGTTPTSNAPLRGGKATMFEGGTRVPCVIVWPKVAKPGRTSHALVQSEDYYPTLLEGLGLPTSPGQVFDGASIFRALQGKNLTRDQIFQFFPHAPGVPDWLPPAVSVHRGDWKLIRLFYQGEEGSHRYLLFDLKNDLSEKTNLASARPDMVRDLDQAIEDFLIRTKAVVPRPNAKFNPLKYRPELEGIQNSQKQARKPGETAEKEVQGWKASKDVHLSTQAKLLVIESTGGDPWISTREVPLKARGPFKTQLRISSQGKGIGTVFYNTSQANGFARERSVDFTMNHDGQMHDYVIELPIDKISAIRLDPGTAPGAVRIESFILQDSSGKQFSIHSN